MELTSAKTYVSLVRKVLRNHFMKNSSTSDNGITITPVATREDIKKLENEVVPGGERDHQNSWYVLVLSLILYSKIFNIFIIFSVSASTSTTAKRYYYYYYW